MKTKIVVIGAGVIGLSTAYNVIDVIPEVEVTVISERFSPNTTSDVAAGIWTPYSLADTPTETVLRWSSVTWDHLTSLAKSKLARDTGAFFTSGRLLFRTVEEDPFWKDTVIGFRKLTDRELKMYDGDYVDGCFFTTVACDQTKYLPWLTERFVAKGGTLKAMKVNDFSELSDYDVIVNCTGNGARDLCADAALSPMRGHVIRARAPWIQHFTISDDDLLHIIVTPDAIVMGMTNRVDDDHELKADDRQHILTGCARLEPSVVMATDLRDCLGFRPVRRVVRLEIEQRSIGGRHVTIVHNYGHGGAGITLHWGCAKESTSLVQEVILRRRVKL